MVTSYKKGEDTELSPNFGSVDFDCRCTRPECTETLIDSILVQGLDELFAIVQFKVTSGFRCKAHNAEVGGATASQHLLGKAADIKAGYYLGAEMRVFAEEVAILRNGGIGMAQDWIHVDARGYAARWTYPPTPC